ncbi:MXRA8 [Cervus elaphus hippelaphus]|uniref:MXRA8 n=1 Tax=Cervus elaphus hippelaphus TaxID=46360 RepID=A0A212CQ97_CEREH|nr:MXRA8 [Cervus elaphus hippelaphus]
MELRAWVLLWRLVLPSFCPQVRPSGPATSDSSVVSESAVSWAAGARAVLHCQSPRMVWTQDRLHDRQRVVHWDLSGGQAGGRARRLVDMYSAGKQRVYEPRDRGRLLLPSSAFKDGNFSLFIRGTGLGTAAGGGGPGALAGPRSLWLGSPRSIPRCVAVEETDEGLYTCNLHHHYCHFYETLAVRLEVTDDPQATGAHWDGEKEVLAVERGAPALLTCVNRAHVWTDKHVEEAQQRRVFHLRVTEPAARPPPPPRDSPGNGSSHSGAPGPGAGDPTLTRGRSVINVIVPEGRAHFFQQLGYVLATLLLFILLLITVVLATRQRRRGGYEYSDKKSKSKGKDMNMAEFAVASGDPALYRSEDIRLDYKNNILKERADLAHSLPPAKNIDLDKEFRKEYCK